MRAVSVSGSIPTKRVTLDRVTPFDTDDDVIDVAIAAARETRSSLFGWRLERDQEEGTAHVQLFTE